MAGGTEQPVRARACPGSLSPPSGILRDGHAFRHSATSVFRKMSARARDPRGLSLLPTV